MLVRSNMFRLEKDIGNDNAVALCRRDGILMKFVQINKLVVNRNQVTIRDLVHLSDKHVLGHGVVPEPSVQISPFLCFPSIIIVAFAHMFGNCCTGMKSPVCTRKNRGVVVLQMRGSMCCQ